MKLYIAFVALVSVGLTLADKGFGPGEQKWGYVTVREGAHMFWWLYYTTADVEKFSERPLLLWLQGGPGGSSTGFGNFGELGPLDSNLNPRNYTWVKDANVLFIDNPVGTGFSYVDDETLLATNNTQIARDLVKLMQGFLEEVSEFQSVPIYILTGSYGAKMGIEFGFYLHEAFNEGLINGQLLGVELGDPWVSPVDSVRGYASYLLALGVVDQRGYENISTAAQKVAEAVKLCRFVDAYAHWEETVQSMMIAAHGVDLYNVLTPIKENPSVSTSQEGRGNRAFWSTDGDGIVEKIAQIMNTGVKQALNLNVTHGAQGNAVYAALTGDFMKPVVDFVAKVLMETDIEVSVVTGQLDLLSNTPGTVQWVQNMQWWGKKEWEITERTALVVDGVHEGYIKQVANLRLYWVNRAGHMVPLDNPNAMGAVLRRITNDYSMTNNKRVFTQKYYSGGTKRHIEYLINLFCIIIILMS